MTSSLPPGVVQLVAADGRISLQLSDARRGEKLTLQQGDDELGFLPARGARAIARWSVLGRRAVRSATAVPVIGTAPDLSFNTMPEWTLPGGTTMFIRLDNAQPGNQFEIVFGNAARLPAASGRLVFSALAAAHRVSARLRIELRDGTGGVLAKGTDRIGTDHPGGTDAARHKRIEVTLDVPKGVRECAIVVQLDRAEQVEALPPYLFISNPELMPLDRKSGPRPLVVEAEGEGKAGSEGEFEAAIAPYAPGALCLALDGARIPLPERPAASFAGGAFSGRSWYVTASEPATYTLYVDGAYAADASLGAESSSVVVPERFLDGDVHHLAIRDEHGLYVLHEDYRALPAVLTPYDVLQRETRKPFPFQLAGQAPFRYRALSESIAQVGTRAEAQQIAHAHQIVVKGFAALKPQDMAPLAFPAHDAPDVSIVIPVHNKVEITYFCLCALLLARNEASFEVVVVDDGSTDDTTTLGDIVSGITIVRHETAQRFIRACNAGVAASKGRYVVLLNNDTEPTAGWLDALVEPFARFDKVGLTGAKLLYPDGRLQEAGGIVWRSGNPWNYGRGANPWEPRFSYTRQTDYLSGAAMMTTREIWDALGGLSDYLEPMYFEDTDFAFKVREHGYSTIFAAASIVYHYEGQTSGTEVTSGMKMYQEVNRPKFKKRWAAAYRDAGEEGRSIDLEKDRGIVGRVAFIDYGTPRPDRDAGGYAAVEEMKLVQSLGFKVTFLPDNVAYLGSYTEELMRQGIEVAYAPYFLSVPEFIEKHGHEFDAFYITRYQIAAKYTDLVRAHAPKAKILFMNADLHFLRELRSAILHKDGARIENAIATRDDELGAMRKADVTLSYNEVEHSVIMSHALNSVKVVRAPWVVRTVEKAAPLSGRSGLSFLGGYGHPPNVEAVEWFSRAVMPLLLQDLPETEFHVYGSAMGDNIRALETDRIRAHGFVEDLADVYDRHRIFVAPLRSGAGIKGKVLGALAHGTPCILSPMAAEGIGLRSGHDCLIADKETEWVSAITRLSQDDALWRKLSENALAYVGEEFSFERGRDLMREAFQAVDIFYTQ